MTEHILSTELRPRGRRTAEEAVALVDEWRSSGLIRAVFCQQRGILLSTLASCQQRVLAMRAKRASVKAGFVEVRPQSMPGCADLTLEIDGGFRVCGLNVSTLAALVSSLRAELR